MNVKAEWLPLGRILGDPYKLRLDYAHSWWPTTLFRILLFAKNMSSGGNRRETGDERSSINGTGVPFTLDYIFQPPHNSIC